MATKINNNEPMSTKSMGAFSSTTEMQKAVDSGSDTSFKKVEDDGSNYESSVHRKLGKGPDSKFSDDMSQEDYEGQDEVFRLNDDEEGSKNKSPLSTRNDQHNGKKHFNLDVNSMDDDMGSAKKVEDDEDGNQ